MSDAQQLIIDVGSVKSRDELHTLLAEKLNFPDYYGMNWDAFDECIRDFPPLGAIRITGISNLENALPREAALLRNCLGTFEAELPGRRKVDIS
jgi:RNAse (barnase) inhibitor barstar